MLKVLKFQPFLLLLPLLLLTYCGHVNQAASCAARRWLPRPAVQH